MDNREKLSSNLISDLDILIKEADELSPGMNLIVHTMNVAEYSKLIFDNLPDYEKKEWGEISPEQVYLAGKYHDIGKVFIALFHEGMLDKLKFDAVDRFNIQEHITGGIVVLQVIVSLNDITDINTKTYKLLTDACLYHHERTDGTGYLRAVGKEIPKIGLLVAVADCFSAGIEKRIYSDAKTKADVLKELKEFPLDQTYVNALERALVKEER